MIPYKFLTLFKQDFLHLSGVLTLRKNVFNEYKKHFGENYAAFNVPSVIN